VKYTSRVILSGKKYPFGSSKMINFVNGDGESFFECNEAEARLAKKAVIGSRMEVAKKKEDQDIAELNLHVSNGGVSFKVTDSVCGPKVEVSLGFFGHQTKIEFLPEIKALETIAVFFEKAATYPFQEFYCMAAKVSTVEYNDELFVDVLNYKSMRLEEFKDMLYPRAGDYEDREVKIIPNETWKWLKKKATERLVDSVEASPEVIAHWENIVEGNIPFGYKLEE